MENRITKETVDEIRAAHATITKAKKEYDTNESVSFAVYGEKTNKKAEL